MDTIFALSSGQPPAGIGVIRVTGPAVRDVLQTVIGTIPEPRRATHATFRNVSRETLDDGLALFFPGPASVTGEDLAEFHCHGGRAVVAAINAALSEIDGCRSAEPGEFTRRAFANGRIDLAEAEGLGDLLSAETELQRRSALAMAGGTLSRKAEGWREALLGLSAQVEAVLDFEDEDDVAELSPDFREGLTALHRDLMETLQAPHAETLREGYRVALAGPPNAGKSTLFNALVDSEAAITAEIAGTTRDVLTRSVAIRGVPFTFVDMAGLRAAGADTVEAIGISRAHEEIVRADLVLWLGPEGEGPSDSLEIEAQVDRPERTRKTAPWLRVSAVSGDGLDALRAALVTQARESMPKPGEAALNDRQRSRITEASHAVERAGEVSDPLLVAENLREARRAFDALVGRTDTEDVLDAIFGRFCIGK
ncbi:tRNA uridine-5-carboxymethylaminomethyl(34) synthesis GTPase MnmE [Aurantiacibacter poecillastricola]|uniref:tRNA uridine-5-carboxymethylaminomethyl(34) synthesis GTPase MnmE n=1 Tax=Aurantiacibacter poecillastricola TaxID=3064385 RepID=UPI00273F1E64|nr:tRNA uridine-5-carboxymethylaminomethyl(34) synthesis GTPase MnmE [Aurantiacibacter sp. 219JJ12-13]MDP5260501.1 tRNA uridine-5-carboxymethylaminomethyl(34) synthesis GTPase MnmE [Aurantiacibacter sp. 219JJ12-13]